MNYLFFDIECSNCYDGKGKICEFGYVVTNEHFQVIKKDVIPMSPGRGGINNFDNTIYKRDPSFEWAYDRSYYFSCKEFNHFYTGIKALLEDKNTIIFGYAVENDIRYLDYACERYKLPYFKYNAYDIQKLMKKFLPDEHKKLGLQDAFKKLCDINEFIHLQGHLSRDDAYMSMRVLQQIINNIETDLDGLLSLYPQCKIDSVDYYKNYKVNRVAKKVSKQNRQGSQKIWEDLVNNPKNDVGERLVCCTMMIKGDKKAFAKLCEIMDKYNCNAVHSVSETNYLVCLDQNDIKRMQKIVKVNIDEKLYTLDGFEKMLKDKFSK